MKLRITHKLHKIQKRHKGGHTLKRLRVNDNNTNKNKLKKVQKKNNTLKGHQHITYANTPFYYIKMPTFKASEDGLKAVILDNDETTGTFEELLNYVKKYKSNTQNIDEVVAEIKDILINTKSLRPGIEQFLQSLIQLKRNGKIDAVIMYTNMSKKQTVTVDGKTYNRPELLAKVFDKIANVSPDESFFDLLIFRDSPYPNPEKYIAVIDKIYNVEGKDNKYLFFDDKPELIYDTDLTKTATKFGKMVNRYNTKRQGSQFANIVNSKTFDMFN